MDITSSIPSGVLPFCTIPSTTPVSTDDHASPTIDNRHNRLLSFDVKSEAVHGHHIPPPITIHQHNEAMIPTSFKDIRILSCCCNLLSRTTSVIASPSFFKHRQKIHKVPICTMILRRRIPLPCTLSQQHCSDIPEHSPAYPKSISAGCHDSISAVLIPLFLLLVMRDKMP